MLVPIFCNGPPPPDKGNNSFSINILKPLQLQPPDYDHTEGHPRHFYLFSGQFFEKIAHVLNLFPPTFASTKTSKSELFRYDGTVRICFLLWLSILNDTAESNRMITLGGSIVSFVL